MRSDAADTRCAVGVVPGIARLLLGDVGAAGLGDDIRLLFGLDVVDGAIGEIEPVGAGLVRVEAIAAFGVG